MSRRLFLHEIIDIVGLGAWPYMELTLAARGDEKVNFELMGTFYTMGITGRWSQVVNLWEVPGGWSGWEVAVDRLNLRRKANRELEAWWTEAHRHRTGGTDRLLAGAPGCPSLAELVERGVRGRLFVHEITEVRPGAALDYLVAVRDVRAPLLAEYGHTLVGLYEVMFTDTEVCTIWATDVADHVRVARARDAALGWEEGVEGDVRLVAWERTRRELTIRWREELMTPYPGIPIGPESFDPDT